MKKISTTFTSNAAGIIGFLLLVVYKLYIAFIPKKKLISDLMQRIPGKTVVLISRSVKTGTAVAH